MQFKDKTVVISKATPVPYWFIRLSQGMLPIRTFDWDMGRLFEI